MGSPSLPKNPRDLLGSADLFPIEHMESGYMCDTRGSSNHGIAYLMQSQERGEHMTSIQEQLLIMERTLKEWMGTDQGATFLNSVRQESTSISPALSGASPEGVAAGKLHSIEIAAAYLREKLGVPLIVRAEVKIISGELSPPRPFVEETD
jgi:hypothetical protein